MMEHRKELHFFDIEKFRATGELHWDRTLLTERYLGTRPQATIHSAVTDRESVHSMYHWMVENLQGMWWLGGHRKVYFHRKDDAVKFQEEWGEDEVNDESDDSAMDQD